MIGLMVYSVIPHFKINTFVNFQQIHYFNIKKKDVKMFFKTLVHQLNRLACLKTRLVYISNKMISIQMIFIFDQ